MIKGDKILEEDTNHITKGIKVKTTKEEGLDYDYINKLLVTIIVGIIVLYAGFYTLFIVYLLPSSSDVQSDVESQEVANAEV